VGRRVAAHGRVEHGRHLRVSGEVVKEARSVGVVERGLPGPHGVQQVAPRSPVRFVEQQQDGRPQGARDARTQSDPHRGQGEAARPDLIEHSGPREDQQDSAEAWQMRPGRLRQLLDLPRAVGQEVGNAEAGRDVDRLRDPIAPNEGEKPLSRLDTWNTARVDRSVHCGGHSSAVRPPAPRPPSTRAHGHRAGRREYGTVERPAVLVDEIGQITPRSARPRAGCASCAIGYRWGVGAIEGGVVPGGPTSERPSTGVTSPGPRPGPGRPC